MLAGIVGCPNSGKSTFFKALTLAEVEIANYPFTTIQPNQGVAFATAECPCRRLHVVCSPKNSRCEGGIRHIPIRILDVAGLVPGAHEGKGLGNQFLNDLTQASGLIHVLDASGKTNAEGRPEPGWDPGKTIEILEHEIDEWIKDIAGKAFTKSKVIAKTQKKPIERLLADQLSGLGITEEHIKKAMKEAEPDSLEFASVLRKISKPIITAANKIDLPESQENFERLKERESVEGGKGMEGAVAPSGKDSAFHPIVPCSADSELALKEAAKHGLIKYVPGSSDFEVTGNLSERQRTALEFIRRNVLHKYGSTGVQKALNSMIFDVLKLIVVYPVANISHLSDQHGNVLPDAHLVPKGTTLKELAFRIHTDIGENFIGGLDLEKRKIGAEHILKDGDVVEILVRR
jgi:ribosome-binding ATPase YchF (GTP1/OBG family)